MKSKPFLRLLFLAFVSHVGCSTAFSSELWSSQDYTAMCKSLPSPQTEQINAVLGKYLPVVKEREDLNPLYIRQVSYQAIKPWLHRAVDLQLGPLELFTDREFSHRESCLLFFDHQTLARIDQIFNIHGLWMVSAPTSGFRGERLNADYVLLGHGRLIVGYPRASKVHVEDYPYPLKFGLKSDVYLYMPFISMDIIHAKGRRGLFEIRTLEDPLDEFQPFKGPFRSTIASLEILQEHPGKIVVRYTWTREARFALDTIPISLR